MVRNIASSLFAAYVAGMLVVGLVQSMRQRRAFIAKHGKTDPPMPSYWEGPIRLRFLQPTGRWYPLKLGLYIRVTPTIVYIASPPWQHIRGIGRDWRLPTEALTMRVDSNSITLQSSDATLVVFAGRRQIALCEALTRAGVDWLR